MPSKELKRNEGKKALESTYEYPRLLIVLRSILEALGLEMPV
jgi:hypothetical protein